MKNYEEVMKSWTRLGSVLGPSWTRVTRAVLSSQPSFANSQRGLVLEAYRARAQRAAVTFT